MNRLRFIQGHLFISTFVIILFLTAWCAAHSAEEEMKNIQANTSGENSFEINDYINAGLTVVGFIVGFGIICFQLNKQHQNSIRLHKQQFKAKIQQEIFDDISDGIYQSTNAYVNISSKLLSVAQKIDTNLFLRKEGINPKPISDRIHDFIDLHHSFGKSIVELIFILEKYVITDRIFELFSMALQSSSYDLEKYYQNVNDSLMKFLPVDVSENEQLKLGVSFIEPKQKSDNELKELKEAISNYNENLINIICYIYDLKIEAQNILLSEIFGNSVSPRKSNDREYVVVSKSTTRSLDDLEYYFMHETEWGKNWQNALKRSNNKNNL